MELLLSHTGINYRTILICFFLNTLSRGCKGVAHAGVINLRMTVGWDEFNKAAHPQRCPIPLACVHEASELMSGVLLSALPMITAESGPRNSRDTRF